MLLNGSLKALAAVAMATFAVAVIAGNPRKPANQYLAAFMALVAANQGVEALRALVPAVQTSLLASRLALVFAALDPFFLYYFASIYPRRNALNRTPLVALVLAGGAIFAASAFLWTPEAPRGPPVVVFAWAAYTTGVYTAALWAVLDSVLEGGGEDPAGPFLVPALSVAALPAWPRVLDATAYALGLWNDHTIIDLSVRAALFGAGVAVITGAFRGRTWTDGARAAMRRGVLLASALVVAAYAHQLYYIIAPSPLAVPVYRALRTLYPSAAALRWLLFGALVSTAVLRHQLLGLSLQARRRAARVMVAIAFVTVAIILLAAAHQRFGEDGNLDAVDLVVVGVALAASQGFHSLVDRVATRVYGVPPRADLAAALQAYRVAVEEAIQEGRELEGDSDLARLRGELGIDAATARVIEEMATATVPRRLAPGVAVAGRYRILRVLGRGGSGSAYLARDALLDRDVALKEVLRDGAPTSAALREARVAGGLQHPNVLTVYNILDLPHAAIIVSEHASGGSLAERLTSGAPLAAGEALDILDDVLSALEAVHAKGVVHRDLKPANILLTSDGTAKVADFGVARVQRGATAGLDAPGRVIGTPAYMAPEQRRGETATPAADVYAVGLLLRRLLNDPLPDPLDAVAQRALRDEPRDRWESAADMRRALRDARDAAGL